MTPDTLKDYIPILLQFAFVGGFVAFVITASHFLGPKRRSARKDDTFECGIRIVGNARLPFSIKYFLVAILFVLFDVEVIFFYPWVVNFTELAINGFLAVLVFVSVFMVGFVYIVKRKVLDWEN